LEREISIAQLIRNFLKGGYEIDLGSLMNCFFYGGTASVETNFCGYPRGKPQANACGGGERGGRSDTRLHLMELEVSEGT
jgi:hypothetical protein